MTRMATITGGGGAGRFNGSIFNRRPLINK